MKILVLDPLCERGNPDIEQSIIGADGEMTFRRWGREDAPSAADFQAADAVLNYRSSFRIGEEIIGQMTKCRVLQQGGVGYHHIDIVAAANHGIPVLHTPDYGTGEVADHAVALALNLFRGVQAYDRRLRRSNESWDARWLKGVRRLAGLKTGVLGLGRIGTAAALRYKAFGMDVGFYDPYAPVGQELALGLRRFTNLKDFLNHSELLSLHSVATPETQRIINAETIRELPDGAIIVNTARGALIDFDALEAALRSGKVTSAGLDVFPTEPLDRNHPLIAAWVANEEWLDDKLIMTPHAAFYSASSLQDIRRFSVTYMMNYLRHGLMPTCVNKHLLNIGGVAPVMLKPVRDRRGTASQAAAAAS